MLPQGWYPAISILAQGIPELIGKVGRWGCVIEHILQNVTERAGQLLELIL